MAKQDKNPWTSAQLETLRKMWAAGKTCKEIAVCLGKTRSGIAGKASRLNLPYRLASRMKNGQTKKKNLSGDNLRNAARANNKVVKRSKYVPNLERISVSNTAYGQKSSMADLKRGQCLWPVGNPKEEGFGFCAASTGGHRNYCAAHQEIAYSKTH